MHIILFDTDLREALLPFTYTRPVCEIRLGILTIREKWEKVFKTTSSSFITSEYLEPIFPIDIQEDNYLINGAAIPNLALVEVIRSLSSGEALMMAGELIAARLSRASFEKLLVKQDLDALVGFGVEPELVQLLDSTTRIAELSQDQILADMQLLGVETNIPQHVEVPGDYPVYIDPEADIERALINAKDGPVYIGPQTLIMDGAKLRGPVSIGAGSVVKSHAFLSKGVCIGPQCEVSGEIKHSVILGYSNKSHEGYVGDSVVGEWCNLGALTTNSNLRNSFTTVKMWDYEKQQIQSSGRKKCGFFMGDYSRTAIHTQINSGTVIGVSCHLFGQEPISSFVPCFTWGNMHVPATYELEKAVDAIVTFRSFKGVETSEGIKDLLSRIFNHTDSYRTSHTS